MYFNPFHLTANNMTTKKTDMTGVPLSPVDGYYEELRERENKVKSAEEKEYTREAITEGYEDPYIGNMPHYKYFREHVRLTDFDGDCDVNTTIDEVCFMLKGYADQQTASLQSKVERYEKALREITRLNWNDTNHHLIASKALNNE